MTRIVQVDPKQFPVLLNNLSQVMNEVADDPRGDAVNDAVFLVSSLAAFKLAAIMFISAANTGIDRDDFLGAAAREFDLTSQHPEAWDALGIRRARGPLILIGGTQNNAELTQTILAKIIEAVHEETPRRAVQRATDRLCVCLIFAAAIALRMEYPRFLPRRHAICLRNQRGRDLVFWPR